MKLQKYIFLDFDGVLHSYGKSFSHLHHFHHMLEMMKTHAKLYLNADIDIHIVFSTSWRMHKTTEQLSKYVASDKIPMIFSSLSGYEKMAALAGNFTEDNRLSLIIQYIQSNHISLDDVLILDDMDILYSFPYQNETMFLGTQFDFNKVADPFYQQLNQRFLLCNTPINEKLAIEGCLKIFQHSEATSQV